MDTFVDSSWYFLRFASPHDDAEAFDRDDVERWLPVDTYSGGIEHAILHLLYSRFITKVLFDEGLLSFTEPFKQLVNQGMVLYAGEGMSKSKGNLVELGPTIERWGADSIRLAMMFAGPIEDDMDWMSVSVSGMHKWLGKVWRAVHQAAQAPEGAASERDELLRATHRASKDVTGHFERFRFNLAISRLMTLTTELQRSLERGPDASPSARFAAEALVVLLAPMAPHIAEELWRETLGRGSSVITAGWPRWDEDLARQEEVVLVIQVDGKVRDRVTVSPQTSEEECRGLAVGSPRVKQFLDGRQIDRVVVRPPRLVNIVTRSA
jgi:leucyl-tRNA synthetase